MIKTDSKLVSACEKAAKQAIKTGKRHIVRRDGKGSYVVEAHNTPFYTAFTVYATI